MALTIKSFSLMILQYTVPCSLVSFQKQKYSKYKAQFILKLHLKAIVGSLGNKGAGTFLTL